MIRDWEQFIKLKRVRKNNYKQDDNYNESSPPSSEWQNIKFRQ